MSPSKFLFLFFTLFVYGLQAQEIDSLKKALLEYDRKHHQTVGLKDTAKLRILGDLAIASMNVPSEAMRYTFEQLALARKMRYGPGIAYAHDNLGILYQSQGNFPLAIYHFKQMLLWKNRVGDKIGEASAATGLGQIYGDMQNSPLAIEYFLKALSLSKAAGDKVGIATAYNNFGVLYKQNGDYDKALQNYFTAQKLMAQLGNKSVISMLKHNIGQIYWAKQDSARAISYIKDGLKIAQEIDDDRAEFRNWNALGFIYGDMGKTDLALKCFDEALRINQSAGNVPGIGASFLSIGRVYFQKSDFNKALEFANKGMAIAKSIDDIDQINNSYELLSKIYEEKRDFAKALDFHKRYKELNDSIMAVDKGENFERLKVRYDLESAQDSIAAVQAKKDALAKADLRSKETVRDYTYLILGLVVLFLIVLLWQRNKIAIVRNEKALAQERNRISRDLHDNMGAQLSTVRMFIDSLRNGSSAHSSEIIENSVGLLDSSIGELRGIMHEMHSPLLLEKGYIAATEDLINQFNNLDSVRFTLSCHNMEQRPKTEIEHQLYRVTQELTNNSLKYAKARNVSIDLLRRDGRIVLMYEDDGIGFNVPTIRKGYGLKNIETRITAFGGTVEFDSAPGAGSRTIIEIPEQ